MWTTYVKIDLKLIFLAFGGLHIHYLDLFKGQLISEWNFGVFKSPKKPTKFETNFCPMAYEARAEICQKFGWLFGRFEDTEISFWD